MLVLLWPWVLRKDRMGGCGIWPGGCSRIKPEDAPTPPPDHGVAHLPASRRSGSPPNPPPTRRHELGTLTPRPDRGCNQTLGY